MTTPRILILSNEDTTEEDHGEYDRFQNMMREFNHFAENSKDPFGPAGFLHGLFDKAVARAYREAYDSIGKSKDPQKYVCAAMHLKKCIELSNEIKKEISNAMGDMHSGDLGHDMHPALQLLKQLGLTND